MDTWNVLEAGCRAEAASCGGGILTLSVAHGLLCLLLHKSLHYHLVLVDRSSGDEAWLALMVQVLQSTVGTAWRETGKSEPCVFLTGRWTRERRSQKEWRQEVLERQPGLNGGNRQPTCICDSAGGNHLKLMLKAGLRLRVTWWQVQSHVARKPGCSSCSM